MISIRLQLLKMSDALNAKPYLDFESLLHDKNVDLVYIASPPYLHYSQSKAALLAGKHVICEKPAALKTSEAEDLVSIAHSHNLLYVVNLMQRYNPLCTLVGTILKENMLGEFLHGFFENYASDEKLVPEHWFWETEKSGGIFIEHGVHFFDLFSGWLGKGELIHAAQWQRPNMPAKLIERVQATVNYAKGPVTFYHGFDQPKVLDRQELRLQFEKGDLTLYEWIPVKIRIHGLLKNVALEQLKHSLPNCTIVQNNTMPTENKKMMGRFHPLDFDQFVTLEQGNIADKNDRYEQLLTAMMKDQWSWIKDRSHIRIIDNSNAVESLRMAETATNCAFSY